MFAPGLAVARRQQAKALELRAAMSGVAVQSVQKVSI